MGIDPVSLAIIGSVVIGAGSSVMGGMSAKREAKKQAARAQETANIQAEAEEKRANSAARIQKMQFIKGGVGALTGSPLLVMQETYDQGQLNASNIRKTGAYQADMFKSQGNAAMTQGIMGAAKSVGTGFLQGADLGVFGGGNSNLGNGWHSTQAGADAAAAKAGITWN
jgi:hypothetical protein